MKRAAEEFRQQGFCFLRAFAPPPRVSRLRSICDRVLAIWKREQGGEEALRGATNAAFFFQPRYFEEAPEELAELLALAADERILALVHELAGTDRPRFRNDQYFIEPAVESFPGVWHRDSQFVARSDEDEKRILSRGAGVHFRVAFVSDPWLEYVPGSEARWDTHEELRIRRSGDRESEMPGSIVLLLEPGDALLFHAWGIHRGRYVAGRERRTLDLIYEWGQTVPPEVPPSWFTEGEWLSELPPEARALLSGP